MADVQTCNLPPVLQEYLPEYEPRKTGDQPPKGQGRKGRAHHSRRQGSERGAPGPKSTQGSQQNLPREKSSSSIHSTRGHDQRARNEKNSQSYAYWQKVKHDTREADHQHLQKRVALQRELIKAQNEYSIQKRDLQIQQRSELRQVAKDSKQAREEALLKICKESLDEDRQKAIDSRTSQMKKSSPRTPERQRSQPEPRRSSYKQYDELPVQRLSQDQSLAPHSISPVMETSPTPREETVEEQEAHPFVLTQEDILSLPWHHIQLYKLYGQKANDFLHPKMEHKIQTTINPKLRHQGGKIKAAREGADVLWDTLREDSKLRLLKEDSRISHELKAAYGAFVRQSLTRHRAPVKRNFFAEEDVPEIEKLMDQSVINRTKETRHKVELMFRCSVNNEDRAKILSHNNPIPDFNNIEGGESIDRYLPSWYPEDDLSTEHSYKKWLRPHIAASKEPRIPSVSSRADLEDVDRPAPDKDSVAMETIVKATEDDEVSGVDERNVEDWDFMLVKRKPKPKQQKIHFVTERDLRCKGEFTKRRKELNDSKGIPSAFDGPTPRIATSRDQVVSPSGNGDQRKGVPKSVSAPPLTEDEYLRKYKTSWEPLSLNALMEYKEVCKLFGNENFRQGRTRMWSAATTS